MSNLVSIIVPVYKVEEYLDQCLQSLTTQSYRNIEIILVDDGSPDRSGEICDRWAQLDSRIQVIHKPNGGLAEARNFGMRKSTGAFLTFVDSDDWVHSTYVERLLDLALRTGASLSVCDLVRTTSLGDVQAMREIESAQITVDTGESTLRAYLDYRMSNTTCGKLYSRELFKELSFPVGRVHEDMFTTYKLIHRAPIVARTSEQLYFYRSRPDSIMGVGFTPDHTRDYIAAREAEAAYYETHGLLEYRDIANRRLYGKYERLIEALDEDRPDDWADILMGFKQLRTNLRKGRHSLRFRTRTEAYFASPRLFRLLRRTSRSPR